MATYSPHSETDTQAYLTFAPAQNTINNMASYSTHSNQTYSPETDTQAYSNLRSELDQTLDTTEHDCELCDLRYGGFDMVMHIHIIHGLSYSDACPCEDCVLVKLNKSLARNRRQSGLAKVEELLFATSAQAAADQTSTAHNFNATPSLAGEHLVFGGSLEPSAEVSARVEHRRKTSLAALHQRYPSSTASPPQPSFIETTAEDNFALADLTQDSRVDSLSPMQMPSVPLVPTVYSTPTIQPAQSAQSVLPAPVTAAEPIRPTKAVPQLLPNNIRFCKPSSEISERNLPYNMSQIESGDLYEANGRIVWMENKVETALDWLDGDDKQVLSVITKAPLKWLEFLPHNIPRDVPAWQLVCWYREAAAQGLHIRHQDLYDRMDSPLTSSGLTGRMQLWQRGVGMLSQTRSMNFNWPSKQSLDTVAGLTCMQARFNTWWDVQFVRSEGMYIARQPNEHAAYRQPFATARDKKNKTPYYFIENPEYREISEHVRLIDDTMLFLNIKAEECGMTKGYPELLSWFGLKAEDKWTKDLDTDLVLEFERWRYGCNDTPSISVLRLALEQAGSDAEVEAIKNADYSLTPWLQDVERALTPLRKARRLSDEQGRHRFAKKVANRKSEKRKIEQVDDVEAGAGGSRRRTN
jgi:hypothetical protein